MFGKFFSKRLWAGALLAMPCFALAADFDCGKAHSHTESMICSDHILAEYDTQLGKVYRLTIKYAYPAQQPELRTAQKRWLSDVRDRCGDVECLANAYAERISTLSQIETDQLHTDQADAEYVLDDVTLKTQLADFQKSLMQTGIPGKLTDCQLMVHVMGSGGGHDTSYGALCTLNKKSVMICDDTMVGKMTLKLDGYSEDPRSLADFVQWNCPAGG